MIAEVLGVFAVWLFVFAVLFASVGEWRWFLHTLILAVALGVEIEARTGS